jgi:uncharacterized protein YkwD
VTATRGKMPVMTRSAPALGLATATVMISLVGIAAIRYASHPGHRGDYSGSLIAGGGPRTASPSRTVVPTVSPSMPSSTAPPPTSQPVARPVRTSTRPASSPVRHTPAPSPAPSSAISAVSGSTETVSSASNQAFAKAVFQAVNEARAGQHLPPLTWDPRLQQSAHRHNLAMAAADTLAHQVGDEPSLGARETAAGVPWRFIAENIGWSTARSRAGALALEASMFAEQPPADAHRRNILSTSAGVIGIDVLIDASHGLLWLTEDFAGLS